MQDGADAGAVSEAVTALGVTAVQVWLQGGTHR